MKTTDSRADWYIPPDWRAILRFHVITVPIALLLGVMFPIGLSRAAKGDTTLLWVALGMGVAGVLLLFLARLPLYRQGKFLSFGPRALPAGHRRLYWIAYGLIGTSVAIMVLLLMGVGK